MLNHLDALYGFAITLTRSAIEADDLVQETYTQAALNIERLKPDSNLKGWLFIIMRNIWLKQLRHVRSGPEFIAFDDADIVRVPDTSDDPQALTIRIWERNEIRNAIDRLPDDAREIIALRDIEGFSYKEIMDILDCPIGTVMSRLARARTKLKDLLRTRQTAAIKKSTR